MDVARADLCDFLAVGPDFVGSSGVVRGHVLAGFAVTVDAHEWAECAELEPAGEELLVGGVAGVASVEATNVARPPRDSGDSNGLACSDLSEERLPGGGNIAAPHRRAVLGLAGPRAATQAEELVFALLTHSFPDHARVVTRVEVGDVQAASGVEAQVGGVTGVEFGFAGVEPENANSQVEIVVLEFVPDVLAGRGVCRVVEGNGERAVHSLIAEGLVVFDSCFGAGQEALGPNFCVRLRERRDSWPHGNHQFRTHFLQFGHHRLGIWVFVFVKAPLPHCGPVDEVGDDHR